MNRLHRGPNTKTVYGATFQVCAKYSWNLITTISATANPSGKLTDDCFEFFSNKILQPLKEGNNIFNGILLHLHGAMVSESYEDCEGELLCRIRKLVGNDIPIIVTLDLHGNITPLMSTNASSLIAVRTYPHIGDILTHKLNESQILV